MPGGDAPDAAADRALAAADDGVVTWESEFRRRRAEFLAALGAPDPDVATELDRALAVARDQNAPLLELRATASAVRLGRAAPDRLARVIATLDEARGTPDWTDADALLGPERSAKRPRNAATPTL